jgi:hypothetical protein
MFYGYFHAEAGIETSLSLPSFAARLIYSLQVGYLKNIFKIFSKKLDLTILTL